MKSVNNLDLGKSSRKALVSDSCKQTEAENLVVKSLEETNFVFDLSTGSCGSRRGVLGDVGEVRVGLEGSSDKAVKAEKFENNMVKELVVLVVGGVNINSVLDSNVVISSAGAVIADRGAPQVQQEVVNVGDSVYLGSVGNVLNFMKEKVSNTGAVVSNRKSVFKKVRFKNVLELGGGMSKQQLNFLKNNSKKIRGQVSKKKVNSIKGGKAASSCGGSVKASGAVSNYIVFVSDDISRNNKKQWSYVEKKNEGKLKAALEALGVSRNKELGEFSYAGLVEINGVVDMMKSVKVKVKGFQ